MKLGTKIMLGFACACVIFLILSIFIFSLLRQVNQQAHDLNDNFLPITTLSADIQANLATQAIYALNYNYSSDPNSLKSADQTAESIRRLLADLRDKRQSDSIKKLPGMSEAIISLDQGYAAFNDSVTSLPAMLDSVKTAQTKIRETSADLVDFIEKLREGQRQNQISEYMDSNLQTVQRRSDRIAAASRIIELTGEMNKNFLRALYYRDTSYFDISAKDGEEMLERAQWLLNDSRTEEDKRLCGQAITLINNCLAALRESNDAVAQNIAGTAERAKIRDAALKNAHDLSVAAEEQSTRMLEQAASATSTVLASLVIGLAVALVISLVLGLLITRSITKPVNRLIETLSEGAQEVDGASGQLSASSNTLAEGATENAASLEETSAALEELSSMTKRNADNAMEAHSLMEQTKGAVVSAEGSMSKVIQAMTDISISGNEIGKIIKTIDEIAFQTNLLALNAAVEAARAGDAGAGFAVVADEVRNLAIRSADAAKNTADLIASTIANINSGSEMVNATAENFKVVGADTYKVAELLAEVSEASKEQSQGIGQITTAMTEMDKVTQSNAASAEESASAAGQLSLQAGQLLEAIEGLKGLVHGNSAASAAKPRPTAKIPQAAADHRQNFNKANALLSNKGHVELDDNFDF